MRAARPHRTSGPTRSQGLRSALAGALALVVLAGCGGEEITPPTPSSGAGDTEERAAGAAETLRKLQRGLAEDDEDAVTALAATDPGSRRAVAAIYANDVALRLSDVSFRYVDASTSALPSRLGRYGTDAFGATVTVSWKVTGYDSGVTREDTRFGFVWRGGEARLAVAGGGGGRTPLWLAEPLDVVRTERTLVAVSAAEGGARRSADALSAQALRAVADVRKVLPRWRGRLVVEEPSSEAVLEEVLGAEPGRYAAIAGVTTTVDGTLVEGAPVHVFLNPQVYGGLGARGAQVVLSHETTHVATDAPLSSGVPTWLLEGFADYVALAHADVPLATAARQIIERVRKEGPPTALPSDDDLSPSAPGLGATYEEAWTVCRYLADTYGEPALVRFYDAVGRGRSLDEAFTGLGTSRRAFVDGWRADLRAIAAGRTG